MGKSGWVVALLGASGTAAFIPAFKLTSIANVSLIYATAPFVAVAVAWAWFREKPRLVILLSSALAIVGVLIIVRGSIGGIRLKGDAKELATRDNRWFRVLGRVAPGASAASANAQIQAIAKRMAEDSPATNRERRAALVPDLDYRLEQAGTNGVALLAIVALVVLISSVNVANLLLSRAGARGTEMAIRLSIGASRGRVIRQLMTENFLLGIAGLLLGLVIGGALIGILPSLIIQPPGFYVPVDFNFDARVLAFGIATSLITIVLFGLAPAWRSARPDLLSALKGETGFAAGGRRWPMRNWLAAAQIGVSLALLASAAVLARSFINTRTGDLGFGRKPILLVWLSAADAKPPLYRDVIAHFASLPGVRSVAAAVRAPLSLSSNGMFQVVTFTGRAESFEIKYNSVTANFLDTMGTPSCAAGDSTGPKKIRAPLPC